jgi:hypothetical protein
MVTLPANASITIPAALRRRCAASGGDICTWTQDRVRLPCASVS